ncbi:MAG: SDR family oxidoreductase [Devosia sp.]
MHIFVTGATGFVGSALVPELIEAGHDVIGLARSVRSTRALSAWGAEVHHGDLADTDSLRSAVAKADAVIHTAFSHDFANFRASAAADQQAIRTVGDALQGSQRPFIITSGLPVVPGRPATEEDLEPSGGASPRRSEQAGMDLAERGVRASVVRMSQVHDRNRQGFATYMMAIAREKEISAYVGDGLNRWAAVHRLDTASLYRLAVEKAGIGARYHAVGEEGLSLKAIAQAIGDRLNLPVVSLSADDAKEHFGALAGPIGMDAPATAALTKTSLNWSPTNPSGLIEDIERSMP